MLLFLRFEVSRFALFSDLSTGEHCPLRIPVLRKKRPEDLAAVSPIDKSRKEEALPPVTQKKEHILSVLQANGDFQSKQECDERVFF
jgi:hypothetical protein